MTDLLLSFVLPTLLSAATLDHALPPPQEVVVVASAAAVVEHLAPPGVDVEGEPLLHAVAGSRVDGAEAGPGRPLLCDAHHTVTTSDFKIFLDLPALEAFSSVFAAVIMQIYQVLNK